MIEAGSGKKKKKLKVNLKYKDLLNSYSRSYETRPYGAWSIEEWQREFNFKISNVENYYKTYLEKGLITKKDYYQHLMQVSGVPDLGKVIEDMFEGYYCTPYEHGDFSNFYFFQNKGAVAIGRLAVPRVEKDVAHWPDPDSEESYDRKDFYGLSLVLRRDGRMSSMNGILNIPLSSHNQNIPLEAKEEIGHVFIIQYPPGGNTVFTYWDICRTQEKLEKSIQNAIKTYGDDTIR